MGRVRFSRDSVKRSDLDYSFYRSRGPGGQHKNKTYSAVRLKHEPTGIVVHAQFGRSQTKNKETALKILHARLSRKDRQDKDARRNKERRSQVGKGIRGEKTRTYNEKKDLIIDHRNGGRASLKRFLKGYIKDIYS